MNAGIDDLRKISQPLREIVPGTTVRGVKHDFRGIVIQVYGDSMDKFVRIGPYQILCLNGNEPVREIMISPEEFAAKSLKTCTAYLLGKKKKRVEF